MPFSRHRLRWGQLRGNNEGQTLRYPHEILLNFKEFWSPLCADQSWQLLRVALPVGGRTITFYEEVHPQSRLGNRKIQHQFLAKLATIIPATARPTVVADVGFRKPFYRYVEETLGWH